MMGAETDGACKNHQRLIRLGAYLFVVFFVITIVLSVVLYFQLASVDGLEDELYEKELSKIFPPPSGSLLGDFRNAAVATDNGYCSDVGRDILVAGGNAVDATLASLLCIGVTNPQSSGLGGGFLMTLFDAKTRTCYSVDAREVAPQAAEPMMYLGMDPYAWNGSRIGYRSIGVPGEIHGYYTVFKRWGSGKIPWSRLFEGAIRLANNGFPVTTHMANALRKKTKFFAESPHIRKGFYDPKTNEPYAEGDIITRKELGNTLEMLANSDDPIKLFYEGEIADKMIAEIQANGGILTKEDLKAYRTEIPLKAMESRALGNGKVMCGPPPPSSFVITNIIVGLMARFYPASGKPPSYAEVHSPVFYHRLVEAEKFGYARRQKLGDAFTVDAVARYANRTLEREYIDDLFGKMKETSQPNDYYLDGEPTAVPEDHGTSHVSALDIEGNAVSVTSTVNALFGAQIMSPELGLIWNNEMDDFSTPGQPNDYGFLPSPANFIKPGRRPVSSMTPMIVYDEADGSVKMVVGASGGAHIISATAQTVIRALLLNETIKEAVDELRIHHQYGPFEVQYEEQFPKQIIKALGGKYQHKNLTSVDEQPSAVQAVLRTANGRVTANSDYRRRTLNHPSGY